MVDYIAVQFHGDGDLIVALAGAQGAGAHPGRFCLLRCSMWITTCPHACLKQIPNLVARTRKKGLCLFVLCALFML